MNIVSSMRLVKLLSAVGITAVASLARAGMVEVNAAPAIVNPVTAERAAPWPLSPGPTQPVQASILFSDRANAGLSDRQVISDHYRYLPTDSADIGSGHILDLAPRASLVVADPVSNLVGDPAERLNPAGTLSASMNEPVRGETRGLALPDSLRMFPLGALAAALAIRRMQRSARRTS